MLPLPEENNSHSVTPNEYTSLFDVKTRPSSTELVRINSCQFSPSGALHFTGNVAVSDAW
jgi:hypothetical protein